jgi:hypothetical protein
MNPSFPAVRLRSTVPVCRGLFRSCTKGWRRNITARKRGDGKPVVHESAGDNPAHRFGGENYPPSASFPLLLLRQ